jgi:hypothetical protein
MLSRFIFAVATPLRVWARALFPDSPIENPNPTLRTDCIPRRWIPEHVIDVSDTPPLGNSAGRPGITMSPTFVCICRTRHRPHDLFA